MEGIAGIKKSIIARLEAIENTSIDKNLLVSAEIIEEICDITEELGKEVAVFIDRKGDVAGVSIGDEDTVALKDFDKRRGTESLSTVRCIHTHPNGNGMLSDVDLSALKKMRLDAMASIGVKEGKMTHAFVAFLNADETSELRPVAVGPYNMSKLLKIDIQMVIQDAESSLRQNKRTGKAVESVIERAVLVGIESEEDLDELSELLKTAGGVEISRLVQSRDKKDTAFFIGKGKLKELTLLVQSVNANLVVFDEELSGAQTRNLEEAIGVKVIDRTQLILDIFAQRAKSRDGKLQVELAQMKYMLPRLIGLGAQMSRTGGGIGTRGPGEKKLEIDRRRIRDRIHDLTNEIKEIKKQRELHRENRINNTVFQVCLVGYTNAGKSTLLNSLANADIYAEDQLFATLDPTTRKVVLQGGKEVLVTDTVGFIRKLPHDLIDAFKSTLEEVLYADLLIHVVDRSNDEYEVQMKTVLEVLAELGAENKTIVTAFNKTDKVLDLSEDERAGGSSCDAVYISAKNRIGLEALLDKMEAHASQHAKTVELLIPYTLGNLLSLVHEQADSVLNEDYLPEGVFIKAVVQNRVLGKVAEYQIKQ